MSAALTREHILERLKEDGPEVVCELRKSRVAASVLRELAADVEVAGVELLLASCPDTPSRILSELCDSSSDVDVREALAGHRRATAEMLRVLVEDEQHNVRLAVATSRNLSPKVAATLAQAPEPDIRLAVAENTATPPQVQQTLAKDAEPFVRSALVRHKALDPELPRVLGRDDDALVRARLYSQCSVSDDTLLAWADSDDAFVQGCLLLRRNLPESVVESLRFSPSETVQLAALSRHDLADDEVAGWARQGNDEVRSFIAARRPLPPAIQRVLADDSSVVVREVLAGNPELDSEVALGLAAGEESVVLCLAANPNAAESVLNALCRHSSRGVRKMVAKHPELTGTHIAFLLDPMDEEVAYHVALGTSVVPALETRRAQQLALHQLPTLRELGARCPSLDPDTLKRLCFDPAATVRRTLVNNPSLPPEALRRLADDDDDTIRETAQERLRPVPVEETLPEPPPPESPGVLRRLLRNVVYRQ